MQNCSKSIENYCFKQKTSSASGGKAPDPPRGLCPVDPSWGLRPHTPVIGSRCRARHVCIIKKSLE